MFCFFRFEFTGTLASDTFFQAYLWMDLQGGMRDRAVAKQQTDEPQPHSYNHLLRHAVNTLAEELMGMKSSLMLGQESTLVDNYMMFLVTISFKCTHTPFNH